MTRDQHKTSWIPGQKNHLPKRVEHRTWPISKAKCFQGIFLGQPLVWGDQTQWCLQQDQFNSLWRARCWWWWWWCWWLGWWWWWWWWLSLNVKLSTNLDYLGALLWVSLPPHWQKLGGGRGGQGKQEQGKGEGYQCQVALRRISCPLHRFFLRHDHNLLYHDV